MRAAEQLAAELRQLGEEHKDRVAAVLGFRVTGATCLFQGNFALARAHLERGIELCDPALQSSFIEFFSADSFVSLSVNLALALACAGFLDGARSRSHVAIEKARCLSHAHTLSFALCWASILGWIVRSDPARVLALAEEAIAISDEHGYPQWRAGATVYWGWCLTMLGDAGKGIPLLSTRLNRLHHPNRSTMLAEAYYRIGKTTAAFEQLSEAEQFAEATKVKWVLAETLRLRGDFLMHSGERFSAEQSFRTAITLAHSQAAKLFELRASTSLARLWRDQGKIADAHDLLAPIYGWFTEGFDAPDLIEAKALLDELGAALGRRSVAGITATTRT